MSQFTILDGGMGRELKRIGAPFRQPEWSALALIESPQFVRDVHAAYVKAGADIITTNSYALVPFHIGKIRFENEAEALAERAGRLARQVAERESEKAVRVAASLPPLFGSYRPDLFNADDASRLLAPLVNGLSAHADLWLAETLSSTEEARVVADILSNDSRPLWFSFTLDDGSGGAAKSARLRSGEPVEDAVELCLQRGAEAILFNCSQPEVMEVAVIKATSAMQTAGSAIPIGVYANAFPPQPKEATANETLLPIREDLDPIGYLDWVHAWLGAGAEIIGGCCGIGPEHIEAIASARSMTGQ